MDKSKDERKGRGRGEVGGREEEEEEKVEE